MHGSITKSQHKGEERKQRKDRRFKLEEVNSGGLMVRSSRKSGDDDGNRLPPARYVST